MDKLSAVSEVTETWGGRDERMLLEVEDERAESVEDDPDEEVEEDPDDDEDTSSSSSKSSEEDEEDERSVTSSDTEAEVEEPESVLVPLLLLVVSGLITRGKRDGRCERRC